MCVAKAALTASYRQSKLKIDLAAILAEANHARLL